MNRLVKPLLLSGVLFSGLCFSGAGLAQSDGVLLDKVFVVVNDEAITETEFNARLERQRLEVGSSVNTNTDEFRQQIRETMIDERIQLQEAQRRGITVSDEQLQSALQFIASRNNLRVEELASTLEARGVSFYQFRENIRQQQQIRVLVEQIVRRQIEVPDDEVHSFMEAHPELSKQESVSYDLQYLRIDIDGDADYADARERANSALQSLHQGADFASVFTQYAGADQSSPNWGWRTVEEIPDAFLRPLQKLQSGEFTDIIETASGFHILALLDKKTDSEAAAQYRVRHIMLARSSQNPDVEQLRLRAEQIVAQLAEGADFADLAEQYSDDDNTKNKGGVLPWFSKGQIDPQFEQSVAQIPSAKTIIVSPSSFGVHVIELLDKRLRQDASENPFEVAQRVIENRKFEEYFSNWMGALRDSSYVVYP